MGRRLWRGGYGEEVMGKRKLWGGGYRDEVGEEGMGRRLCGKEVMGRRVWGGGNFLILVSFLLGTSLKVDHTS